MSSDAEVAALKKELQQVKSRAVSKIKALQSTVDELSAKLAASSPSRVDPPESSEDGSEASSGSGFVKVGTSVESLRLRERECEEREAALAKRRRCTGTIPVRWRCRSGRNLVSAWLQLPRRVAGFGGGSSATCWWQHRGFRSCSRECCVGRPIARRAPETRFGFAEHLG